jgi:tRNA dimethylallyltransferase
VADKDRRPVWFLMGPTASGKTDLAIELAERFPFEVISVDSSMVYQGMDIGTAKPHAETLSRCPHHLIDIRAPEDTYSAAEFFRDACSLIEEIHERGRYPLLVGGTMFYFRTLELGLPVLPEADPELRRELEERAGRTGWAPLYTELEKLDPVRASRIKPGDRQRVQRALEIAILAGKSPDSSLQPPQSGLRDQYRLCKLALAPADRSWLHERIERRFDAMLSNGLVREVRGLLQDEAISPELPAMRMVGYRQVVQYLSGELEYNEAERRGVAATRQLAKRQLTWLRNQSGVIWLDCTSQWLENAVMDYVQAKLAASG